MSSWLLRQSEDSEEFHSASLALLRLVTGSILAHCTQATAAGAGAASDRKQAAEKQLEALAQPILAGVARTGVTRTTCVLRLICFLAELAAFVKSKRSEEAASSLSLAAALMHAIVGHFSALEEQAEKCAHA